MNILPHENDPLYGITIWIETNLIGAPASSCCKVCLPGHTHSCGWYEAVVHQQRLDAIMVQIERDDAGNWSTAER